MRLPIRLNPTAVPRPLRRLLAPLSAVGDPSRLAFLGDQYGRVPIEERSSIAAEYSRCVSALKFGNTYKTTAAARLTRSEAVLEAHLTRSGAGHVVVDLGASDGTTSVDLYERIQRNVRHFIAADLNDSILACNYRKGVAIVSPAGEPIVDVTPRLLWYADATGANWLYRRLVRRRVERFPRSPEAARIRLLNPRFLDLVSRDPNVEFLRLDMFEPLPVTATAVRVSNLLNLLYFPADRIAAALRSICRNLADDGLLLISRDSSNTGEQEDGTLFRKSGGRLAIVDTIGSGSEVEPIASSLDL
jgi:SAM-dependent methyltransferase